ncbi:glyceraldehyde 3-phosphate dehydrogenase NAD-binding domain-containing protein [Streptomyces sp. NPDC086787]|uniref:glyceraldehyde 3-phosphate dehydrogenase NAD-binding domain-containing protein n=1 Tax=Streptomyces sp. NPDC086787 TaxID=3365759 RepID=UPI0037F5B1A7
MGSVAFLTHTAASPGSGRHRRQPYTETEFTVVTVRAGVNGFGRIGRADLRAALDRSDASVQDVRGVAINDISSPATLAQLLAYSTFGRIGHEILHDESSISFDGTHIAVTAEARCRVSPPVRLGRRHG